MIPGVIRGVIASSWLRAMDGLRAPNNITTAQELPPASAYVSRVEEPMLSGKFRLIGLMGDRVPTVTHSVRACVVFRRKPLP